MEHDDAEKKKDVGEKTENGLKTFRKDPKTINISLHFIRPLFTSLHLMTYYALHTILLCFLFRVDILNKTRVGDN